MPSPWTHSICVECWKERNPNRPEQAVSVLNDDEKSCCFCGKPTKAGIYVRHDPRNLRCKGEHD